MAQTQTTAARSARQNMAPFLGLLDSVLVEEPVTFEFDGAILRAHAAAAWTWIVRDVASDLIDPHSDQTDPAAPAALNAMMPELLARCRAAFARSESDREQRHRLMAQLGGEEVLKRLPTVLTALRCRALLEKAQVFGRVANGKQDDHALGAALQAMPLSEPAVAALLLQAAFGQITNPGRLVTVAIRIAGSADEGAVVRAGFAPLIDAILAHAQNQIPVLGQVGPFADIDLTCRAIERFHRLVRAVNSAMELNRNGRWAMVTGALVKSMSERLEPRIRDVVMDVNRALRRHREGADRLDSDQLLSALNGVYLLATVRECRDSLALNAIFDQTWTQVGDAIEVHTQRNLEAVRANPRDKVALERLAAGIKMAELRFNPEYADVLRRAGEAAERRGSI